MCGTGLKRTTQRVLADLYCSRCEYSNRAGPKDWCNAVLCAGSGPDTPQAGTGAEQCQEKAGAGPGDWTDTTGR